MARKIFHLIIFFIAFLFGGSDCMAQHDWMQQCGGITIDEGADVSVDAAGNTYATGYFTGAAGFGTFTLTSGGLTDIYLVKQNPGGLFQWAVKAGGIGIDRPTSIKTDSAGNSYLTGYFYDTATFGSLSVTSSGAQDIFIAKYSSAGACLWVKRAGGIFGDLGNGITVDNSGNVIVAGEFAGTALFGSTTLASMNGSVDVFTTKLDTDGNFLWAKKGSAHLTDRGLDVAADASGNIYVTGQFTDTITFDVTHDNNMYNAIFLVKYNPSGAEQWFRRIGGGSQNIANAIVTDGFGNPVVAGDFQGALTFFSAPGNTTLNGTYLYGIFITKYDGSGNKLWSSQSSSGSEATIRNLAVDGSGNFSVVGNFRCKFNGFADQYGQGTFHSAGYWDIFVSKWNAAGVWQWARQAGGHSDEYGTGIAAKAGGEIIITGSFLQDFIMPVRSTLIGFNVTPSVYCTPVHCSDNYYGQYAIYQTTGNSDIFIAKTIGPLRQPYDYYERTPAGCDRSEISVCIEADTAICPDTVMFCQGGSLTANPNTCASIGPGYNYLWSNGSTSNSIPATTAGMYSVTQTSLDGCFVSTDSVYVIIYPVPLVPSISDDVVINTNSPNPDPINLCLPDSVVLTGGDFGSNSHTWTGPGHPGDTSVSITVTVDGTYCFTVTGANGCTRSVCVLVTFYTILPPFIPKLICLSDPDLNDTVSVCQGVCFEMFVYDSVSNPGATVLCLPIAYPYQTLSGWAVFPYIPNMALCNARHLFCPDTSGTYLITLLLVRLNICDTDTFILSKSVYVIVNPVPVISVSVTGNPWLCPGDSNMIVTSGCPNMSWSGPGINGSTADTVWATQPGYYSVSCFETNSFGCMAYASAGVTVQYKPQPLITMIPSTGLICPNDSVQLTCSGAGTFQWQGPGGPIGGNTNSIYVNQPGNYYCILTDTEFCSLVSNTAFVTQYATPYLQVFSNATICPGDSIVIYVVAGPGSIILWDPPLSGNALTQTVDSAGVYSCTIISCGIPTTSSVTIGISNPVAQITATGELTFCEGNSVLLSGNSGLANYLWLPDSVSGQNLSATVAGLYTLVVTDSLGCVATDTISVFTYPNSTNAPSVSDTTICRNGSVTLTANGIGNIYWFPSAISTDTLHTGNSYSVTVYSTSVTYYVQSEDSGCNSARVPVHVFVDDCDTLYIPNVFTPNGDTQNDIFYFTVPVNHCFHARIFNRWGKLMYEWNDATRGWNGISQDNGKPASDGVYYYILRYCNKDMAYHYLHGFLELLR